MTSSPVATWAGRTGIVVVYALSAWAGGLAIADQFHSALAGWVGGIVIGVIFVASLVYDRKKSRGRHAQYRRDT